MVTLRKSPPDEWSLPVMQESLAQSLHQEDPLEKGMAAHSSILACRISMDRRVWQATVPRVINDLAHTHQCLKVFSGESHIRFLLFKAITQQTFFFFLLIEAQYKPGCYGLGGSSQEVVTYLGGRKET